MGYETDCDSLQPQHSWGSRQVSPAMPVRASSDDWEAVRRFPYGYPHIVSFDDGMGATAYAVRIRLTDGTFDVVGEETPELDAARVGLEALLTDLSTAFKSAREIDEESRIIDAQRAMIWEPDADTRAYIWGIEDSVWPHMKWQEPDQDLLASLPDGCLTIQVSVTENGERLYDIGIKDGDGIRLGNIHQTHEYISALLTLFHVTTTALCVWEWYMRPQPSHPLFQSRNLRGR